MVSPTEGAVMEELTQERAEMTIRVAALVQEYAYHGATLLGNWLKHTAAQSADGFKITYAIGASVSGTQRGSAITNNQLSGSVTSTTSVTGTDTYTTYRAQIFPSGSAAVVNTFLFKINKA